MQLIIFLFFMTIQDNPDPIANYHWENRILIIFTAKEANDILQEQLNHFENHQNGMNDRDLVIFKVFQDQGKGPQGNLSKKDIDQLYQRFQPQGKYTIVLVGKDGTEKLRQSTLLSKDKIFATIDAMPMRKAEMRRKQ
ncbi:MAG: DUF4174 domain-containing protein [Candidatus Cyclobacteriaceae bacterium M3_2C_046]